MANAGVEQVWGVWDAGGQGGKVEEVLQRNIRSKWPGILSMADAGVEQVWGVCVMQGLLCHLDAPQWTMHTQHGHGVDECGSNQFGKTMQQSRRQRTTKALLNGQHMSMRCTALCPLPLGPGTNSMHAHY